MTRSYVKSEQFDETDFLRIKLSCASVSFDRLIFIASGAFLQPQRPRSAAPRSGVGWSDLCTPSMGMTLWGERPLSENSTLTMLAIVTTSRRQGQLREVLSEGGRSAKPRADEQKSDTRPDRRDELTHDNEVQEFARHGKSGGCVVADICSCNICIPAIHGGYRACSYLGRSVVHRGSPEQQPMQKCSGGDGRSQQRS